MGIKNNYLLGRCLVVSIFYLFSISAFAQHKKMNKELLNKRWPAFWITCPGIAQRAYGVYHFRKSIMLPQVPDKYIVHVSGDNRYRLLVNGQQVSLGPARGDLYNWYYETVDLAPYLKPGKNILAALIWNMGEDAAIAQISNQTAFVVQGDDKTTEAVNTDSSWKVLLNKAYTACSLDNAKRLKEYMVIGPGDRVDGKSYPWGWELADFDDSHWQQAEQITHPEPFGFGTDNRWTLTPRTIPLMEESLQRMGSVRRCEGVALSSDFLKGSNAVTIPPHKKVSILVDQGFNTVAYPQLLVSGGAGAQITITYAESLFKNGQKGNRNEVKGKQIAGNYDIFLPDGKAERLFRPLWLRTYRYIQLDITTAEEPLTLNDFYGMATGYPFNEKATFASSDTSLQKLWQVGWRTARLCAGEVYYDCPYYEQLQYEGDTRIQSLISLYVTGDDRLMRKAITDFYHSRVPEGLTQGRYPSSRLQVIPPFSLYWVSMLYDYMMHRNDDAFLKPYLLAAQGVLTWFEQRIDTRKNMLGPLRWWNFTDWSAGFQDMGTPPGATNGNSAIITLQYAYTLKQAAQLFAHFGEQQEAAHYNELAGKLTGAAYRLCFNKQRNLFSDTPEKTSYSQHASIMGILSGAVSGSEARAVMNAVLSDTTIAQATFYYRFYLTQAMKKAGLGDKYYGELMPWRDMLKLGLTTFAEKPDPTRSDCHAWSASPNYDFLATLCGIEPTSPNFKKILVAPQLGTLKFVRGKMPTPHGDIAVDIKRRGLAGVDAVMILPDGTSGAFKWKSKLSVLQAGKNVIKL